MSNTQCNISTYEFNMQCDFLFLYIMPESHNHIIYDFFLSKKTHFLCRHPPCSNFYHFKQWSEYYSTIIFNQHAFVYIGWYCVSLNGT